jgi:hypothetical protein
VRSRKMRLTAGGYITVENRIITINKKPPARW